MGDTATDLPMMQNNCKSNLQSIVASLNPPTSNPDRQDLLERCKQCIVELRQIVSTPRTDKGGGFVDCPEARNTLPVVKDLLRHLKSGDDVSALETANEALGNLKSWF